MERYVIKGYLNKLFWKAVEINPTTTGTILQIAKMTEPLSRRDFLKIAGTVTASVGTGLPNIETSQNLTADIVEASDKFVDFFNSVAEQKGFSTSGVGFFAVRRGFENTEFAVLPPQKIVMGNGETKNVSERLFLQEHAFSLHGGKTTRVVELERNEEFSGGNISIPIVTWKYLRHNPRPNKSSKEILSKDDVLWYPRLTNEQWQAVNTIDPESFHQLTGFSPDEFYGNMGFAPATSVLSNWLFDTSFNRESGAGYRIDLNNLNEGAKKYLLSPVPVEIPTEAQVQLPPEMTKKYTDRYESLEEGVKQVNDVDTNVIYGIKKDGSKHVVAMEIETEGKMRMTRVGEYTDESGFSYYVVMGKIGEIDGSVGGRFQVDENAAKKLFEIDDNKNIVNIWNSLASQWGLTPEQARDRVMIDNGGFAKFNVAVGIPTSNASWPSKSYGLSNEVNFNLPVELIAVATKEEYEALPEGVKSRLVYSHRALEAPEQAIIGGLVWVKPNGQLQIFSVGTPVGHWNYLNPDENSREKREGTNKYLKEHIVPQFLLALDLVSNPSAPVPSNGTNAYLSQSSNVLEIDGFVNSSSQ